MENFERLLSRFHPGQLYFLLRVSSNTLPTGVNLCTRKFQCSASYVVLCSMYICDSHAPQLSMI